MDRLPGSWIAAHIADLTPAFLVVDCSELLLTAIIIYYYVRFLHFAYLLCFKEKQLHFLIANDEKICVCV